MPEPRSQWARSWPSAGAGKSEFALFGSVLRDDFRPDSDIDVLVTFSYDAHWSLSDWVDMIAGSGDGITRQTTWEDCQGD